MEKTEVNTSGFQGSQRQVLEAGDIIQIVNSSHHWYPALLVVDEVLDYRVRAYLHIPSNDGPNSVAYINLDHSDFLYVGSVLIMRKE